MRDCVVADLGAMPYGDALRIQREIAEQRKRGEGVDHLLFVEHPHVVTIGRNGHQENLLAPEPMLHARGIELYETDRGGDVTYHGPGQLVGYPIIDLREWKRDVGAYVRAIEQVLVDTLNEFGITARAIPKLTGVWVGSAEEAAEIEEAKIAAIGVHLSRWVSTHGWALNVTTDLRYFQYIVPCGLTKPVTSMRHLGVEASMGDVKDAIVRNFGRIFDFDMRHAPVSAAALMGEIAV
ncbi:MAG TPA: lipoyl(octanoyl) transferase LipB [Bryobacteraceae bacterium]|nr:lipoyl(octanoyl) transferase LipB [Bryobacteraceae bacterium]